MTARKPPIEKVRWTKNMTPGRGRGPQALATLHESVGMLNAYDLAVYCERAKVSYHAIADRDQIVYCVDRKNTAWHLRNGNPYADGLCLTSPVRAYSRDEWLGPEVNKVAYAAWWLATVCQDRGIDLAACSLQNVRDVIKGHKKAGGVITHDDYTRATRDGTHNDPRNFPVDICIRWAQELH